MKIIILNLPKNTSSEQLEEMFRPYGSIDSCNMVMDNKTDISKGFGFVEMPSEEEAKAAITALHGKKVGALKIRVKEAVN